MPNRRKYDTTVKIWKMEMSSKSFTILIVSLCITAIMIFSFNFKVDLGFIGCQNKSQDIPDNLGEKK